MASPTVAKYGGEVFVTNSSRAKKEGPDSGISVVIEFADMTDAENFCHSTEYTAAKASLLGAAETDLILAEGLYIDRHQTEGMRSVQAITA